MNFAYGVIAAVGVLVALSLGLIAADPDYVIGPYELEPVMSAVDDAQDASAMEGAPDVPVTVSLPPGSGSPGCDADNECYIPYAVSVNAGDTVTWSNDDSLAHTVTSGSPDGGPDGLFDSGIFPVGATFDFTFDDAGEYDYYCIVHPWMEGIVIVA